MMGCLSPRRRSLCSREAATPNRSSKISQYPRMTPQKVIEVMSHTPGQLADCLHFLGLSRLLFGPLGIFAFCNVTNVTLDDLLTVHSLDIANELHVDGLPAFGLERQVFVTDILFSL
jgi:hypothetical protein